MDLFIKKCFLHLQQQNPEKFSEGLVHSNISVEDIISAERILGTKIPDEFVNFLQAYKLPQMILIGKFLGRYNKRSLTYSVKTETYVSKTNSDIEYVLLDVIPDGIWNIENLSEAIQVRSWNESYRYGYIFIGEFAGDNYLFYDCETGKVIFIDHEEIPLKPQSKFEMDENAFVLFESFNDFLKCFFLGEHYNEDQLEFGI